MGKKPEEVIGQTVFSMFPEEIANSVMLNVTNVMEENTGKVVEEEIILGGEKKWYRTSTQPLRDENGNPIAALLFATDITARKIAELQVSQSEQKYRSLFEYSPDGYLIFQDGVFVECNKASEKLVGGTRKDIIGKRPDEISPEYQPNGKKSFDYVIEVVNEAFSSGKNEFEWTHRKVDGTEFLALIHLAPVIFENRDALLVSWKDITLLRESELAIKKSEEKYRLIFETIRDVYYEADLEGNILEISPSIRYLSKEQFTREDLIGKTLFDFYLESEDRTRFLQLLSKKGMVDDYEVLLKNKDGSIIPVSISSGFINDSDGKPVKIAGSVRDITERRRADEEMRKFRTITNKANYGVAIAYTDGELIYINPAWAQMHGWEVEEVAGKNITMFHNQDQLKEVGDSIKHLFENQEFDALEIGHSRKDGSTFPTLMNAVVVSENNRPLYMSATAIDITELKNSQQELINSEEQLNYAQEIAKMGSWDMDLKSGKTNWSKNYYRLIERDPVNFKSSQENFYKIIHPQDHHLIDDYSKVIMETRTSVGFEMRFVMPDGRIKWVLDSIAPEFSGDELVALYGVIIDITAKKDQETEINRLRLAIEQSPVAVILTDDKAQVQYVNKAFMKITGYSADEIKGRNIKSDNILIYHQETDKSSLWDAVHQNGSFQGELFNYRKDGTPYWESININTIFDQNQTVTGYLAIKQDITERKKIEEEIKKLNSNLEEKIQERTSQLSLLNKNLLGEIEERNRIARELQEKTLELEQFFNVALDLLCIADTSGNFIKVNKAWESILGYSALDLEKKLFLDFVHPEDIQATLEAMATLDHQNPIINFTNRYRCYDGQYRYIEWHSVPVGNKIYAAARDVTERMMNEAELRAARKEAELANTAKSEFLSRMSHELRTPMNSILGFAQLLDRSELNTGQKKGVHHILSSGKHLLDLINEVLDISRIEAGRMSFSPEPVQVQGVIAEMIDIVQIMANSRQIQLQFIDSEAIHQYVKADRQRLRQILLNLINNAIKYNHEGGKVWVSADIITTSDMHSDAVRISVTDTGSGISKEDISKLFIPFERIGAENTETEGTGLGLTVVKKLVELMGGIIGVESTPGEGSTFWIMLPRVDSHYEQNKNGNIHSNESDNEQQWKGHVLYIEDNKPNIDLVQDIIDSTRPGIKLSASAYGKPAPDLAKQLKPDLILLDLNLPDAHGSEVLKILKSDEQTKSIPVVIITADAIHSHIKALIMDGAVDCIIKPLEIDNFLTILDKIFK